jgi:hypothetical protein
MKKNYIVFTRTIRFMALAFLAGTMLIGFAVKAGTAKPVEPSKNFVPKITYAVSYDKLWDAIMIALDKNRITVLSADKTSGIIQTDYFADKERRIAGGFLGIANTRWKCNLTLRNQSDGSIKLNITAKCEATTRGDEFFDPKKAPEQWHDVTSLNVKLTKRLETWFYEQIEKELNIGNGGDAPRELQQPLVGNSEVLTNDSIVQLVKAGKSEEIVVSMIKTQPTRFDLGVDGVLCLKSNNVSDTIIKEMAMRGQIPMKPPIATTNMITDPAVEKLCEALDQDNPGKVKDALNKLRDKKLRDNASQAVPKILPCLTDSKPDVVREACRTLAIIGNLDAVPALLPLLTHERPDIVREACRTLADIGNKDTIPSLEPLLMNPRSDIRDEARKAITKLRAKS